MKLTWTVSYETEFPESDIERICDYARYFGWDNAKILDLIHDVVMGFEDDIYYAWDHDKTMEVYYEIQRRVGGVQLNMFDEEEVK